MFVKTKNTEEFGLFSDSRNVDAILMPIVFLAIMGLVLFFGWAVFS
jgi:fumarate reductase subunit D